MFAALVQTPVVLMKDPHWELRGNWGPLKGLQRGAGGVLGARISIEATSHS